MGCILNEWLGEPRHEDRCEKARSLAGRGLRRSLGLDDSHISVTGFNSRCSSAQRAGRLKPSSESARSSRNGCLAGLENGTERPQYTFNHPAVPLSPYGAPFRDVVYSNHKPFDHIKLSL